MYREATEVEQAILDRALSVSLSNWRITGGSFTFETDKGTVLTVKKTKNETWAGTWMSKEYCLEAVTPAKSRIKLISRTYPGGEEGNGVREVEDLYDRLRAHFRPILEAAKKQQADEERNRRIEEEKDILRNL